MSDVFIEAQILILDMDGDDLKDLVRIGRLLECDLALFWTKFFFLDGYLMIPMVIRAYGDELVSIFREAAQHHGQITPYVGTENLLEACAKMDIATDMRRWFDPRVPKYIWGDQEGDEEWAVPFEIEQVFVYLKHISLHNQNIAHRLPFWATGFREMAFLESHPLTLEQLNTAIYMAENHSICIFYQMCELRVDFYFKISDYAQFDAHLNALQGCLGLEYNYWRIIYGTANRLSAQIEAYSRLTHNTIPAFLEAIKPHL